SQNDSMRKVSGGMSATPSFMTGQLKPQIRVRSTRTVSWRRESWGMDRIVRPRPGQRAPALEFPPMTFLDMLQGAMARNDSLLCVGLDPEPRRLPGALRGDVRRIYDFCAAIVDATCDLVCAFKPQIAYFAAHRAEDQLERL